jgi:hypothetical protein
MEASLVAKGVSAAPSGLERHGAKSISHNRFISPHRTNVILDSGVLAGLGVLGIRTLLS